MTRRCQNPRCGEPVAMGLLCPSCRLAAGGGGVVAFLIFCVGHLLGELDWLAMLKHLAEVFAP